MDASPLGARSNILNSSVFLWSSLFQLRYFHSPLSLSFIVVVMSRMYFRPPEPITFDENRALTWKTFQSSFEIFIKATGIEKETEDVQVVCLLNLIGDEGRKIYSTFQWAVGEDKDKLKDVMKKFNGSYSVPFSLGIVCRNFLQVKTM
jgi:hypothetical protein